MMRRTMALATENLSPLALKGILNARTQLQIGRFCKFAATDDAVGLSLDAGGELQVDTNRMMVGPVLISTPSPDRVADVVVPTGIRVEKYKLNPVVLWEHGFSGEDGGSLPIATSEDPQTKELRIEADESGVRSWDFFHGQTRLSEQVFRLIDLKAIRAKSIRPSAIVSQLVQDEASGEVGLHFLEWDLIEHSWCGLGCNPEAVAKCIRDQQLDGKQLAAPILKSFSALGVKPAMGIGMPDSLKTDKTKADKPADDADAKKTEGADDKPAETGTDKPADEPKADDAAAEDDSAGDDIAGAKYGAQVLSAVHTQLKDLTANLTAALGPLENEEVKSSCEEMLSMMGEQLKALEGLYSSAYSDQPALMTDAGGDDEAPDEEAMKSFLGSGRMNLLRLKGYGERLKSIIKAPNITEVQRRVVMEHLKGLEKLETEAKSHTKSAIETAFDELKQQYTELHEQVKQVLPFRRSG